MARTTKKAVREALENLGKTIAKYIPAGYKLQIGVKPNSNPQMKHDAKALGRSDDDAYIESLNPLSNKRLVMSVALDPVARNFVKAVIDNDKETAYILQSVTFDDDGCVEGVKFHSFAK